MQAFAVLASDGSIHTWGDANFGGTTVAVDPLPKAVALYSTQVTDTGLPPAAHGGCSL